MMRRSRAASGSGRWCALGAGLALVLVGACLVEGFELTDASGGGPTTSAGTGGSAGAAGSGGAAAACSHVTAPAAPDQADPDDQVTVSLQPTNGIDDDPCNPPGTDPIHDDCESS